MAQQAVDLTVTALAQAAQKLAGDAKAHKRAEAEHRRRAREARRQVDAIREVCRRAGIDLIVEDHDHTERKGVHSGRHSGTERTGTGAENGAAEVA